MSEPGIPPTWWTACHRWGRCPLDVEEIAAIFSPPPPESSSGGTGGRVLRVTGPGFLECPGGSPSSDLRGPNWVDADLLPAAPDARRFENWEFLSMALVLGNGWRRPLTPPPAVFLRSRDRIRWLPR